MLHVHGMPLAKIQRAGSVSSGRSAIPTSENTSDMRLFHAMPSDTSHSLHALITCADEYNVMVLRRADSPVCLFTVASFRMCRPCL